MELNQHWWNERAALHGQDSYYDTAAFLEGASSLLAVDHELVGAVEGVDLVHFQCHTGLDTLSWLRAGAGTVTGVDFSPVAVNKARATATTAGLSDRTAFVCAEIRAAPAAVSGAQYDVCYASRGVFGWIADLDAWMRAACAVLRPGGRLAVIDMHPLYTMPASLEPLVLDFPYGYDGARTFTASGSYAQPDADTVHNDTKEYGHSLGEIVTAAANAGLRIDRVTEYLESEVDDRNLLTQDGDGCYRWRITGECLPMYFGLRATRPSSRRERL